MIWNVFLLPFPNTSIPVIESSAGMPVRSGSRGGLAGAFLARRLPDVCFVFDLARALILPAPSWFLQHDVCDRVYFPNDRHPTLQAGRSRTLPLCMCHVKKQRAINFHRNRWMVKVVTQTRQLGSGDVFEEFFESITRSF